MRSFLTLAFVLLPIAACTGSQVKPSGGGVGVVIRRIDVVEADYDSMMLKVIIAVENDTSSDIEATADASVAIVGEAPAGSDGETAAEDAAEDASAPTKPIEGEAQKGSGRGRVVASNTSELPLMVEVALPSDPATLESVLTWKKMLVYVNGKVVVGGETRVITGHREVAPPHLPDVILKEAQVASQDQGSSGAGFFKILLDNKNPFPVTIDKMAYTISIKGKALPLASGTSEVENDSIPASAVAEYEATVDVNEAAFGKELKAILKSPAVPYVVDGTVEVRGIKKAFHFAGDMRFAR